MYSMGVILLELFQPFGTEMERTEVLTHLRTGQIPHTFYKKWPTQAKYVKLLTSLRATERPTAAQLRDSELFHTTDQVTWASNPNPYSLNEHKKKMPFVSLPALHLFGFELNHMFLLRLFFWLQYWGHCIISGVFAMR